MRFIVLLLFGIALGADPANVVAQRGCATDDAETWEITVAGDNEPGEKLVVEGVVTDPSGSPVSDAIIYVYQADARGYYAPPGQDASIARLCGHMRTGADGRFRFHTIRPGSYPQSRIPSHVHFVVSGERIDSESSQLEFIDDPFVSDDHVARDRKRHEGLDASYYGVQTVTRDDSGVLKCTRNLRVTTRS